MNSQKPLLEMTSSSKAALPPQTAPPAGDQESNTWACGDILIQTTTLSLFFQII